MSTDVAGSCVFDSRREPLSGSLVQSKPPPCRWLPLWAYPGVTPHKVGRRPTAFWKGRLPWCSYYLLPTLQVSSMCPGCGGAAPLRPTGSMEIQSLLPRILSTAVGLLRRRRRSPSRAAHTLFSPRGKRQMLPMNCGEGTEWEYPHLACDMCGGVITGSCFDSFKMLIPA